MKIIRNLDQNKAHRDDGISTGCLKKTYTLNKLHLSKIEKGYLNNFFIFAIFN